MNYKVSFEEGKMILEIDLQGDTTPSASGKSDVIASTRGNVPLMTPQGKTIYLGLNVYQKR